MEDAQLTLVQSFDEACALKRWLSERRDFLAVDTETTGLNVGKDRLRLVQLGDERAAWALPYPDWRGFVKEVVERYEGPQLYWNALFDTKFLRADGVTAPQRWVEDAMIMGHLTDPVRSNRLKDTAARALGEVARAGQDMLKLAFDGGGWDFATIPVDHPSYWAYGSLDTVLTARVGARLWPQVRDRYRRVYELELAFINVLRDAEVTGLLVDLEYCRWACTNLRWKLEVQLTPQLPDGLNPLSETQVVRELRAAGAQLTVLTEKGNPSTDEDVLKALAPRIPVAGLVLEYRKAAKLLSSYFEKMLLLSTAGAEVDVVAGTALLDTAATVHPSTKPVGARTGRTSVTDPPLQTIPRGRVVRDAFLARPGHRLILCDYSGMEARAMAADANCTAMLEVFARDEDVHRWTAAQIYGCTEDEVSRTQRDVTKNAGYAKIYGAGAPKFAVTAGIRVDEAEAFLTRYDELFPEVSTWQQRLINEVQSRRTPEEWGWVETPFGRRLPVEPNKAYKATNFRIQGGCAEAAKAAAVRLANAGLGQYFRLFVHDELMCEAPEEDADDVTAAVAEVMRDTESFPGVLLDAEGAHYARWGDKYGDESNPLRQEVETRARA